MENIVSALGNAWLNIKVAVQYLSYNRIVWGFCVGFIVSTMVHLIVILDKPSHIGHMLSKSAAKSYKVVVPTDKDHPDYKTLAQHTKMHKQVRVLLYTAGIIVILGLIFAFIR